MTKLNTKPPIILLVLISKKANKSKKTAQQPKSSRASKLLQAIFLLPPLLNSQIQSNARDGFDAQGQVTVSAKI